MVITTDEKRELTVKLNKVLGSYFNPEKSNHSGKNAEFFKYVSTRHTRVKWGPYAEAINAAELALVHGLNDVYSRAMQIIDPNFLSHNEKLRYENLKAGVVDPAKSAYTDFGALAPDVSGKAVIVNAEIWRALANSRHRD